MLEPKISIIIPVYNPGEYLKVCLDTIIHQTYSNFEVLAINDGSTDYSYKLLKEYASKDERIRVFYQENQGPAAARNLGLEQATGDYVTFIDADDYVTSNYLERLVTEIQSSGAEIAISDYYRYDDKTNLLHYHLFDDDYQVLELTPDEVLRKLQELVITMIGGKLVQTDLFNRVRFRVGHGYEDTFTVQKLYLQATKIVYVKENLYCYRLTNDSVMDSDLTLTKIADLLTAIEENVLDLAFSGRDIQLPKNMYITYLYEFSRYFEDREMLDHPLYRKIQLRLFELGEKI